MAKKKFQRKKWINVYKVMDTGKFWFAQNLYNTKKEAQDNAAPTVGAKLIDTVKIFFEDKDV